MVKVFAVVHAGTTADNLLELNHIVAGRTSTMLRTLRASTPLRAWGGSQHRGNGFFVVLKGFVIVLASHTIIGGNAHNSRGCSSSLSPRRIG